MKKTIRSLLLLLLSAATVFSFAACQKDAPADDKGEVTTEQTAETEEIPEEKPYEPENAAALWEKIDETMNGLDSYETSSTVEVTYYYMGNKFDLTTEIFGVYSDDGEYMDGKSVFACEELSVEETMYNTEAYYDGKMYISTKDSTYDQKLCSEMTYEEYSEVSSESLSDDVDFTDCTRSEFSKDDDGNWTLKFSGYTKKTVNSLMKNVEMSDEDLGATILDVEVSVTANADFCVNKIDIVFSFDVEEGDAITPKFTMTSEYSKFNEALFDPAKINTEEYTVVDDVRIIDKLYDGIEESQNALSGSFTLDIKTTTDVMGATEETYEKDTVSYGKKNGAYYYDIDADVNGENVILQYQGGVQTVTVAGETQSVAQTEEDAKATVDSLIDSANYAKAAVTGIEKKEDGVYLLSVAEYDVSILADSFAGTGIELESGSQEIYVTVEEDEVTKIESRVNVDGSYYYDETQSMSLTMVIESVVTFGEISESATEV